MSNSFVSKMESFVRLSSEDRRILERAVERVQRLGPRENIIREGEEPNSVNIVLDGWACRYKVLPDGRRQIISLLLPGDMCDPHVFLLSTMDHTLGTITAVTLAKVPGSAVHAVAAASPALAEALNLEVLTSTEIQREWTVSLGRRTAVERLAHLFCELTARMHAVGRQNGYDYEFPLTQSDLADAMGLSTVHVNRTLQELKARKIVETRSRRLTILDWEGLQGLAMFDPGYLHQRSARDAERRSA